MRYGITAKISGVLLLEHFTRALEQYRENEQSLVAFPELRARDHRMMVMSKFIEPEEIYLLTWDELVAYDLLHLFSEPMDGVVQWEQHQSS